MFIVRSEEKSLGKSSVDKFSYFNFRYSLHMDNIILVNKYTISPLLVWEKVLETCYYQQTLSYVLKSEE